MLFGLKMLRILAAVVLMLCPMFVLSVSGAEWHVSPTQEPGGDGSVERPFHELDEVRDALRAARAARMEPEADTVFLHPGTYQLKETFELSHLDSGASDYEITWKAFKPHTALLSGEGVSTVLAVYDAEHIQIEGLDVSKGFDQGVEVAHCKHVKIVDCSVSDIEHTGLHLFGGQNCEITRCRLSKCQELGIRVEAGDAEHQLMASHIVQDCMLNECGTSKSRYAASIEVSGIGSTLKGNQIQRCSGAGVRIFGDQHEVVENHLSHTCLHASGAAAITLSHDSEKGGNRIESNTILHVGETPRLDAIGIYLSDHSCNTIVRGNIIANAGRGIAVWGGADNQIVGNRLQDCLIAVQLDGSGNETTEANFSRDNLVSGNLLKRSGPIAVDSIATLSANRLADNVTGEDLFVDSVTDRLTSVPQP